MILNKSKSGLDWQAGDQGGVTVLHLAQRHSSKKLLQVADKKIPWNNLYISLLTKLLLGKFSINRENVDVKDINKRTPLHWAAAHGCYDQVQLRFALTPCAKSASF